MYSLIDHKIDRVCMQFKLKLVTERDFQVYHVEKDYELREFIEQEIEKEFQRGYVYYELTDEMEDISEDKEIIFQNKVTSIIISDIIVPAILSYSFICRLQKGFSLLILIPKR